MNTEYIKHNSRHTYHKPGQECRPGIRGARKIRQRANKQASDECSMEPNTTWPGLIWPVLLDSSSFFFSRGPLPWSECWLISASRCFVHDDHGEHEHKHGPSIKINQSWGQATKKEDDNLDMSLSELLRKQASKPANPPNKKLTEKTVSSIQSHFAFAPAQPPQRYVRIALL